MHKKDFSSRKKLQMKTAFEFLNKNTVAVIATVNAHHVPQASTVYYVVDATFALYFMTRISSRKYKNILNNSQVALVIGTTDSPINIQIEGVAEVIEYQSEIFDKLTSVATKHQWPPLVKLPGRGIAFFKVTPLWVRFLHIPLSRTDSLEESPYTQIIP